MNGTTVSFFETSYCMLKLINFEEEAVLSTENFEYIGSITLNNVKSINDMLTGNGILVYKKTS